MTPDVQFHLSHEAFDGFAELLAPHGITVRDTSSDVHENLETRTVAIESRSGFLIHEGREFAYRRQKTFPSAGFPSHLLPMESPSVRVFRDGSLSVTIADHDPDAVGQLISILELVFPDPPRALRSPPSTEAIRTRTRYRLVKRLGCFILILFFAAFCFFAFYGIRAFIRSF